MVVCLAAQVLCMWSRMALCRRSDVSVNVLYSKPAMRRGSRVLSCEQSTAGVVIVPCRDLLFRPASGDPACPLRLRSGESASGTA